jgi:hypothetical protein
VVRRRLGLHHHLIADYSTGRKMYPWERALYRAGAADQDVALAFDEVGSRRHSPLRMLDPRFTRDVARALTHRRRAT